VSRNSTRRGASRGFTLIEVLVALVIVAFGIGAVLSALSASAVNVTALRDKTVAQWIALNQVSDVRLNLQSPQTGTTEGDVKGFGNASWHWQQIVTPVQQIPGLLQITVKVRRTASGSSSGGTISGVTPNPTYTTSSSTSSSATVSDWVTTVVGFRGDAIQAASGETPDWNGQNNNTPASSSSSSGGASSGSVANPGITPGTTNTPPTTAPSTPAVPGNSSSGGP
jgi:type II secretion system protein I